MEQSLDPAAILFGSSPLSRRFEQEPDGAGGAVFVSRFWDLGGDWVLRTTLHPIDDAEEAKQSGLLHSLVMPALVLEGDQTRKEEWYRQGVLHREQGPASIGEDQRTGTREEAWYRQGELDRENGPAFVVDHGSEGRRERWYERGQLHRDDGPAAIDADGDHRLLSQAFYARGELHREDGPAIISSRPSYPGIRRLAGPGPFMVYEWWDNGALHREDGPAREVCDKNGRRLVQEYFRHDDLHREDGPARIVVGDDAEDLEELDMGECGPAVTQEWYEYADLHRQDGPARLVRRATGELILEEWYSAGVLAREDEQPVSFMLLPDGAVVVGWNPATRITQDCRAAADWLLRTGRDPKDFKLK